MSIIPSYLSRHETAALLYFGRGEIDVLIENGVLHDHRDGRGWSRIPTDEVEHLHGRPITPEDFLSAKAKLRAIRDRQPCRNRDRRNVCPA